MMSDQEQFEAALAKQADHIEGEYRVLLDLCAQLAHAYGVDPEPNEEGVWAAAENIYEHMRYRHLPRQD
jgi:hypothetical protein